MATKKVREQISPLLFFSIVNDPGWEKIQIRDKHPGSAILLIMYLVVG
jgi:hypothetical protein